MDFSTKIKANGRKLPEFEKLEDEISNKHWISCKIILHNYIYEGEPNEAKNIEMKIDDFGSLWIYETKDEISVGFSIEDNWDDGDVTEDLLDEICDTIEKSLV